METTLKDRRAVEATVEVTATAAEVDAAYEQVLRQYARQVRIPGFRPGKAPRGVLIRRIGEEALAEEVREALIDDVYERAVREHELTPLHAHAHGGAPQQGEPYTFELHMDLYPDFELPDVSEIVIDTEAEPVTDEMVQDTVENLRREQATLVPVDRPAQAGDQVLVRTVGEDGEPRDEGGIMPIDLDAVDERIAEQLVGRSIDDLVELVLADPAAAAGDEDGADDDGDEDGDGEDAAEAPTTTLRVLVVDVKERELPEPDDEFAKTLGYDDWNAVLAAIRSSLEAQARDRAGEEQREEFVEKLMEGTEVELPNVLVNRRKLSLLENLGEDLQRQGISLDAYLTKLDEDEKREEFEAELQESAEKGVKRDLVLEKLLEARGAEISDREFEDAIRYLASREGTDPASFRRDRGEEWLRNYRFLLQRDKAVRAVVAELVGDDAADAETDEPGDAEPRTADAGASDGDEGNAEAG